MNSKNETRLYNVIFPFWMLLLFPQIWLIVLPGNFAIDSIVLLFSMIVLKIENKKQFYKKQIFKIFIFGMLSDFIGSAYMFFMMLVFDVGHMGDELYLTIPGFIISAVMIFILNHFITFRNTDRKLNLKLSLIFAVFTAPYTFFIPSSWLY